MSTLEKRVTKPEKFTVSINKDAYIHGHYIDSVGDSVIPNIEDLTRCLRRVTPKFYWTGKAWVFDGVLVE